MVALPDIATYRTAIRLMLSLGDRFGLSKATVSRRVGQKGARNQPAPLEGSLPAAGSASLALLLIHLEILDISNSTTLAPLGRSSSLLKSHVDTEPSDAIETSEESRRRFLEVSPEIVSALESASVHACDLIAERSAGSLNPGWKTSITPSGLGCWFEGTANY